jgi:hypothetical protein
MEDLFWGAISLALLGVLIGLLVLMVTQDVHNLMANRH